MEDHSVLPGIEIRDCGYKVGLNGVDNGALRFRNVRIPRDNLLNRFGDVSRDGEYTSKLPTINKRFAATLGELVGGRVGLAYGSVGVLKAASTVAIRYSIELQLKLLQWTLCVLLGEKPFLKLFISLMWRFSKCFVNVRLLVRYLLFTPSRRNDVTDGKMFVYMGVKETWHSLVKVLVLWRPANLKLLTGSFYGYRYSLLRQQFGPPNKEEVSILDYQSQQQKLMPMLSSAYAFHFATEYLVSWNVLCRIVIELYWTMIRHEVTMTENQTPRVFVWNLQYNELEIGNDGWLLDVFYFSQGGLLHCLLKLSLSWFSMWICVVFESKAVHLEYYAPGSWSTGSQLMRLISLFSHQDKYSNNMSLHHLFRSRDMLKWRKRTMTR